MGSKIPYYAGGARAAQLESLYLVEEIMHSMNSSRNDSMSKAGRAAAYESFFCQRIPPYLYSKKIVQYAILAIDQLIC